MKKPHWLRHIVATILVCCCGVSANADGISLNFSENKGNQGFAGGQNIGPLATDSANWNNTNDQAGPLDAGSMASLKDDSGANTGVSVTWSSSNVWYNNDGTGDDEHKMAVGYLDDGDGGSGTAGDGIGVSVTFSNIPYANYRVYGLLASDQTSTNYDTLDFTVNGVDVFGAATTAPAYTNMGESFTQTGSLWSLADGTTRGNYWQIGASGSSLTITAPPRDGANRASLSAVIVQEIIPEPSSLAIAACGSLIAAGAIRRRK